MFKNRDWRDLVTLGGLIGGPIVIGAIFGINHIINQTTSPISLPTANISSSSPNSSINIKLKKESPISVNRISPDKAVTDHYKLIQSKHFDESWNDLSKKFQGSNLAKGIGEYKIWWDSVESIYIGNIETLEISQNNNNAVVKADLKYKLRTGRMLIDQKKFIYLVWDNDRWLINEKSDSYVKLPP
jgi:hypothetical protein